MSFEEALSEIRGFDFEESEKDLNQLVDVWRGKFFNVNSEFWQEGEVRYSQVKKDLEEDTVYPDWKDFEMLKRWFLRFENKISVLQEQFETFLVRDVEERSMMSQRIEAEKEAREEAVEETKNLRKKVQALEEENKSLQVKKEALVEKVKFFREQLEKEEEKEQEKEKEKSEESEMREEKSEGEMVGGKDEDSIFSTAKDEDMEDLV